MSRHLDRELENLKRNLLMIGTAVETAVQQSFRALSNRDAALADKVIADDEKIDEWEIEVEEACLKTLALYRPDEKRLRFIVAALKMNMELERMGDLAANLAEMAKFISDKPDFSLPLHMKEMDALVSRMVRDVSEALVTEDEKLCRRVTAADSKVDNLHLETFEAVEKGVKEEPERAAYHLYVMTASRQFERIADHATNIAEDIVYMISGEIIRHHVSEYFKSEE